MADHRMDLREKLAELVYEQWRDWIRHVLSRLDSPSKERYIAIWREQLNTSYAELPSISEKEINRIEADKILKLLSDIDKESGLCLCNLINKKSPCSGCGVLVFVSQNCTDSCRYCGGSPKKLKEN